LPLAGRRFLPKLDIQQLTCYVHRVFGAIIYFVFATLSYVFVFDKETFKHPKYLKNQIWMEIKQTNISMPFMSLMTLPFFLAEVRGYTKLYDTTADGPGRWYDIAQFGFFLVWTDCIVYWIHRGLHHPRLYKTLHKPHHKWIVPTPYAAYAFHPVDGFAQSLPYHFFPFFFPLQKLVYVGMFVFINLWTVMIHDGEYVANSPIINGAACHTMHHLYFNYNYGQYTTLWDRLGGSYRKPDPELFKKEMKMTDSTWKKQVKEMEVLVVEVEGKDDRTYDPAGAKKNN
jgi:lathosterol oxidase